MKNYRAFKRYQPNEWEDDNDWKGSRLAFLWFMRDYYPNFYMDNSISEEVYDFYVRNDSKVMDYASSDYNSIDFKKYDSIYKGTPVSDLKKKLDELYSMKEKNPDEFLLKKNCNLYDYLLDKAARW